LSEAEGFLNGSRTRPLNPERCAGWTEAKHDAASRNHLQIHSVGTFSAVSIDVISVVRFHFF